MLNKNLKQKLNRLKDIIIPLESVVVAFSGGVDSSLLLKSAHDVLGDKVLAVIIYSELFTKRELDAAVKTAQQIGCKYKVLRLALLKTSQIQRNHKDRCYICKKLIMQVLLKVAKQYKLKYVIEGSNFDDLKQHRPGKKSLAELGIISPLVPAKLKKLEIRQLLKNFGFEQWNNPSSSCLATRFPYDTKLNNIDLAAVASAETLLNAHGFRQLRVRMHEHIAMIEVNKNKIKRLVKILDKKLINKFKKLGFSNVCIDAEGFCSGSMDILEHKI